MNNRGFGLIEALVVISIVGIIAAIVMPRVGGFSTIKGSIICGEHGDSFKELSQENNVYHYVNILGQSVTAPVDRCVVTYYNR